MIRAAGACDLLAKRAKSTRNAAALELEAIRVAMKLDKVCMALALGVAYRTYQDYAGGQRPVPEKVLVKARAEEIRQRELMQRIVVKVQAAIDRQYPLGIPSDLDEE